MTDDLNRLRAVALTDDERARLETWERDGLYACPHQHTCPSPVTCRERYGLFAEVESIVAARTAALLDRAERAETERDETQEYRDLYKLELDAADADLAALRAAVTAKAESCERAAAYWTDRGEAQSGDNRAKCLALASKYSSQAAELRSLLAAAPTEAEGENT